MQCSPYYHVLSCGPLGGAKETEGMDMRDMRRQSIQHVQFKVVIATNHPNKLLLKILRLVCIKVDHSISLAPLFCLWSFLNETLPCCPVLLRTQQWHFGGLPDSKSPILATLVPSEERIH